MNNVHFERLLSAHPKLNGLRTSEICLRDMIYQYYLEHFDGNEFLANESTHDYIAKIWDDVGKRSA